MKNNIMPQGSPVLFDGKEWMNLDKFLAVSDGIIPDSKGFFYVVFKSKYLNMSNQGEFNLFSAAVYMMGDENLTVLYLRDFNDYGEIDRGSMISISDIPQILGNHNYFDDKDLDDIYYIGIIENHEELAKRIFQIIEKDGKNNPLSFYDWS